MKSTDDIKEHLSLDSCDRDRSYGVVRPNEDAWVYVIMQGGVYGRERYRGSSSSYKQAVKKCKKNLVKVQRFDEFNKNGKRFIQ